MMDHVDIEAIKPRHDSVNHRIPGYGAGISLRSGCDAHHDRENLLALSGSLQCELDICKALHKDLARRLNIEIKRSTRAEDKIATALALCAEMKVDIHTDYEGIEAKCIAKKFETILKDKS